MYVWSIDLSLIGTYRYEKRNINCEKKWAIAYHTLDTHWEYLCKIKQTVRHIKIWFMTMKLDWGVGNEDKDDDYDDDKLDHHQQQQLEHLSISLSLSLSAVFYFDSVKIWYKHAKG